MTSALPALSIGAAPRSVAEARAWVVGTCRALGRPELAECAELAISELVTNAILHGEPPLSVSLGGTPSHPRFQVSDGSRTPPRVPELDGDDDSLTTIGRGLRLVATCSEAWGAQVTAEGKTVWFVPVAEAGSAEPYDPLIEYDGTEAQTNPPVHDPVVVHLRGLSVGRYREYRRHLGELRRELRLLALANDADYPLAAELSELFQIFERTFTTLFNVGQWSGAADGVADVEITVDRTSLGPIGQLADVLELADDFARSQRLLAVAQSPTQLAFTRWYLGEYVSQGRGNTPVPWIEPPAAGPQPPRPRAVG